jgi:Family of unknown function (DUF5670)
LGGLIADGEHFCCRTASYGPYGRDRHWKEEKNMLWTIAVILFVLWALGMVSSYTMGGFVHILLVLALVVILVNFISGRRTVL